jgi:hypothetical protein
MASTTHDITGITRGNDVDLKFIITTSRAIVRARLVAKRQITDGDGSAVIDKQVTPTATGNGQIIQQGGAGAPAIIVFTLTKIETQSIQAEADHVYDMEGFDLGNMAMTSVGGKIRMAERVRTAIG